MANTKRKRRKEFELSNSHLLSLGLIGFGFLYILSLISFSIDDLPAWVPFSHTVNPTRPAINFLGPPGATWAGISFYTIGVTSYLIPAIMIWFGAARLIKKVQISKMGLIGFGILLVSGCCLMHYQKWFLQSGSFHISGTGGIIGEYVGKNMKDMTGAVGSFLIMSTAYCAAALLITRVHPGQILQAFIASYKSLKKWREHRIYSKANENDRLLIQKKKLEKEQRQIEKKIGKTIQLNQYT